MLDNPYVRVSASSETVECGMSDSRVSLDADVYSYPTPEVTWYKDNKSLPDVYRIKQQLVTLRPFDCSCG
jgi:hypothetical protein